MLRNLLLMLAGDDVWGLHLQCEEDFRESSKFPGGELMKLHFLVFEI